MSQVECVLMIGVALSGKTTFVKANLDHECIALSHFENDRKKECKYIEKCLILGKMWLSMIQISLTIRKLHIDLAKEHSVKIRGIFMNISRALLEKRQE